MKPHVAPIRTDDDLTDLWRTLMGSGGFDVTSLWLVFVRGDDSVAPLVVPIDGIPEHPDETVEAVARICSDTLDDQGLASAAFLLSRPGPPHVGESDRAWGRALLGTADSRLRRWPVHLATHGTVRVLPLDDLLETSAR